MAISLKSIAINGITKAKRLSEKYTPPNNAIAAIGVKFGMCGNNRLIAANKIADVIKIKRAVKVFDFIEYILF